MAVIGSWSKSRALFTLQILSMDVRILDFLVFISPLSNVSAKLDGPVASYLPCMNAAMFT